MNENKEYINDLKSVDLKITKQRIAILDILEKNVNPITAEDIYAKLMEDDISINLSTVYRILEIFAGKDLVIKLNIAGNNKSLFERNLMDHKHYLVCTECKKILAINYCPLGSYEQTLEQETKFKISGHKLDVYGLCPQCQKKSHKNNDK